MSELVDVRIRWLPTRESGRRMPAQLRAEGARSYKPHFQVGSDGEYLGVAFLDGNPPEVSPGDEGDATVALIYTETDVDYSPLAPGAEFEVLEGARVIGRGLVLRRWRTELDWRSSHAV